MKKTRNCGLRPWVGPDGLGCGIIRRLNTRFDWNAAPKGAAFFLRVAKDEMQWQLYEAALTLKRLLGKLMRGSTFEEMGSVLI